MDNRKWEADAIVSPPTAPISPSNGYPTNGDPGAAQNATEPGAWWFHAIGEELRAVIEEGGLTPSLSTLTQLRDAIKNIAKGGDYKESVRVASTANVAAISGLLTIDGVTVVSGNRVLLKDQTTASQNGIYIAAAGAWARSTDADTGAEFNGGAIIPVEEGTLNADLNWQISNNGSVVIGTTALTFQCIETKLFTGSNVSVAANGYQKLPSGLILQWGNVTSSGTASNNAAQTFPIAFPTSCLNAYATPFGSGGDLSSLTIQTLSDSLTQFKGTTLRNGAIVTGVAIRWLAIGY